MTIAILFIALAYGVSCTGMIEDLFNKWQRL